VQFDVRELFGFGQPLDYQGGLKRPGVLKWGWGAAVTMVADALGVELDEIRETCEFLPTPRQLDTACGVIEAGTVGATYARCIGVVDGQDVITIEHVDRMADDLAPQWPTGRTGGTDGIWRVIIDGEPSFDGEFEVGYRDGESASDHGLLATGMRAVNAIPWVCEAPAGIVDAHCTRTATVCPRSEDHDPRSARQAQKPLAGQRQQDLFGAAGDRQTPSVEEVVHDLVLDDARPVGQVHPKFGQRLPVTHPDEFAHAGLRTRIPAAHRELGDALVEQRTHLRGDDQSRQLILLRDIDIQFGNRCEQLFHRIAQRGASGHRDPLVGQRGAGQSPTVVHRADHHLVGDEHAVQEDLVEQCITGDFA
jgi:hypothetical protein